MVAFDTTGRSIKICFPVSSLIIILCIRCNVIGPVISAKIATASARVGSEYAVIALCKASVIRSPHDNGNDDDDVDVDVDVDVDGRGLP